MRYGLGACRTLGRDSEKRDATDKNLTFSQANSGSIGQENGEFLAEQPVLQPRIPKSDRLLTVSRSYALQIIRRCRRCRRDGLLRSRRQWCRSHVVFLSRS